jgi:GxxExxY protein
MNNLIPFQSYPVLNIKYKKLVLRNKYNPDFLCFQAIIVEIKALDQL